MHVHAFSLKDIPALKPKPNPIQDINGLSPICYIKSLIKQVRQIKSVLFNAKSNVEQLHVILKYSEILLNLFDETEN